MLDSGEASPQDFPLSAVVVGDMSLTRECSERLLAAGHRVVCIVSQDLELLRWAEAKYIKGFPSDRIAEITKFLEEHPFDHLFSIANGIVIPEAILRLARRTAINFHDGPLPEMAGFFATTHALMRRHIEHGITWHRMTMQLDAGTILSEARFGISPDDSAFTLNAKCFESALQTFDPMIKALAANSIDEKPQDLSHRQYFSRYDRPWGACGLDFRRTAIELEAFSRALDFGPYANPFGVPTLLHRGHCFLAPGGQLGVATQEPPGTVIRIHGEGLAVATGGGQELILPKLLTMDGLQTLSPSEAGIGAGDMLEPPSEDWAQQAAKLASAVSRHEPFWVNQLKGHVPVEWPVVGGGTSREIEVEVEDLELALTNFSACIARMTGQSEFDLGYVASLAESMTSLFSPLVPLRISLADTETLDSLRTQISEAIKPLERAQTYHRSLPIRYPELQSTRPVVYPVVVDPSGHLKGLPEGAHLMLQSGLGGQRVRLVSRDLSAADLNRITRMLQAQPVSDRLDDLPFLSNDEMEQLVYGFNQTHGQFDRTATIQSQFEAQVERTPEAPAASFGGRTVTYSELAQLSTRMAVYLQNLGVGPESIVGVSMPRSIELLAALIGVLRAGAAYLPLDPDYPEHRIEFVLEDAQAKVLLVRGGSSRIQPRPGLRIIDIDSIGIFEDRQLDARLESMGGPSDLAYVIYTSGSTGKPKGVMVEQRNVTNFFAGMDQVLGTAPGVWLAVTSISFDISVLELFWTLTRGFHVVLAPERVALESSPASMPAAKQLDFSLFYFGNSSDAESPYRLLLEGAKFADENGFVAVWTPERHFHAFGGLYPNPSVMSAALATITRRVQLRAGSVVSPLHHPVRIVEEWAVVDHLSGGRVGISLAPGWNEKDFVFAPENYGQAKQVMTESLDAIRSLWRGDAVSFRDGKGNETPIRTFPRPVSKDIPIWITAAGNPETFRLAGLQGCNLLTHLLGQTVEQVAAKIEIYRQARREADLDPAGGRVTLMLHTMVGESMETVREAVRRPMKDYLLTSVDLIRRSPWSFPVFQKRGGDTEFDLDSLSGEEMEALLEHSFLRYFETSGLFGSVAECEAIARKMQQAGADEIACLIDFGVPTAKVLDSLKHLNEVRQRFAKRVGEQAESFAELVMRHGVTHLQCTPSMAGMIVDSPSAGALQSLRHMLVGGEALTATLADALRARVAGTIHNMYGPTETTVWSTTQTLTQPDKVTPIGRPILNTQIYLLDSRQQLVAPGRIGELYIGGDGVTRGYLNRPELTGERFIADPFQPGAKLYRTGDLACYREDGTLDFLGRSDQQVKLRGFRIELTEIESVLGAHPQVSAAALVVRDQSLIAFLTRRGASSPSHQDLREWVANRLPEYMVPAAYVLLDRLPHTPNGKVDRKSLPTHQVVQRELVTSYVPPRNEMEAVIAEIFRAALGVDKIGVDENFFDLGAHSLMIVQVRNQLQKRLPVAVPLLLLFRFPTVSSLAAHLSAVDAPEAASVSEAEERSKKRQEAIAQRIGRRGSQRGVTS